jgi:hypothetical protein
MPCSPRRRIPLASVIGELTALAPPGRASQRLRRLDASHGRQDHTVLPYAARLRQRPRRVWYPSAEALAKADSPPFVCRPPHSEPNVRDDRDTPLLAGRNAEVVALIWGNREQVYFCGEDWTGSITLIWLSKLDGARKGRLKRMLARPAQRSLSSNRYTRGNFAANSCNHAIQGQQVRALRSSNNKCSPDICCQPLSSRPTSVGSQLSASDR